MATSINRVFLVGRLGGDPNVRSLSDGTKVCDFPLATGGEKWTSKDGREIETPTAWHNVVVWRGLAEMAEKHLKKGYSCSIIGEISYRQYEDKEGNRRFTTDIIATDLVIGNAPSSNRQQAADPSQYAQPSSARVEQSSQPTPVSQPSFDGGMPF